MIYHMGIYVNIFALVLIEDRWEKYILNNLLVVGVMWGFSTLDELLRKKTKIKFCIRD